jgi:hypothetical protein
VLFCYLAWVFIYRDLRQFFALLPLLGLMTYGSLLYLSKRSSKLLIACLAICAGVSIYFLYPVYSRWFPLIFPSKSSVQYLQENLDYYSIAQEINGMDSKKKILALGETRSAYITKPMIVPSAFDKNPFFEYLAHSRSKDDFLYQLNKHEIGYIFCNWAEYRRLVQKCGLLPVDVLPRSFGATLLQGASAKGSGFRQLKPAEKEILQLFFLENTVLERRKGDYLFLYRIVRSK